MQVAEHLEQKLDGECGDDVVLSVDGIENCLPLIRNKNPRELVEPILTSASHIWRKGDAAATYASNRSSRESVTKVCTNSSAIVP